MPSTSRPIHRSTFLPRYAKKGPPRPRGTLFPAAASDTAVIAAAAGHTSGSDSDGEGGGREGGWEEEADDRLNNYSEPTLRALELVDEDQVCGSSLASEGDAVVNQTNAVLDATCPRPRLMMYASSTQSHRCTYG